METAILTCPYCGAKTEKAIKEDSCEAMYQCEGCGVRVKAKESCCVICEYSDKKCPVSTKA